MFKARCIFVLLLRLLQLLDVDASGSTQERHEGELLLPPIACPEYFEYMSAAADGAYIGRITLPDVGVGTTLLTVRWSQRSPIHANDDYRLSLFYSNVNTAISIKHGGTVSYRVDFAYAREPPLLLNINVNGVDICDANDYLGETHVVNMTHTLNYDNLLREHPSYPPSQSQHKARIRRFKRQAPTTTTTTVIPAYESTENLNLTCGREGTNLVFQPYVYRGANTLPGQFPWLAAIFKTVLQDLQYLCVGSLISTQAVLSAAHCFRYPNTLEDRQIFVFLGRYNLGNDKEMHEKRAIKALHIHPEYDPNFLSDADIAILHLISPVSFSEFIQPICLWHGSSEVSQIVGQRGVVVGWGADEMGRNLTNIPKMVNASIVSEITCRKSKPHFSLLTSSRTLCAGNRDGSGPCTGDSGGGLMIKRDGHWMLRGIVSAGLTRQWMCQLEDYVVYCDLAKHLQWVKEKTEQQLTTTANNQLPFTKHSRFSHAPSNPLLFSGLFEICGRELEQRASKKNQIRSDDKTQVMKGQYPWIAAIFVKLEPQRMVFRCGGSLITTRLVITAVHCFIDPINILPEQIEVQLGRHNLSDYELYETRDVQTVHFHPDYNPDLVPDADIAILELRLPLSVNEYIHPICLWPESTDDKLLANETGLVVGWRTDGQWRVLEKLNMTIISTELCLTLNAAFTPLTASRSFCAYNPNGTTFGIGGYGLMMKRDGRWMLRGIGSMMNREPTDKTGLAINCDVAQHSGWVYSIVLSNLRVFK